MGGGEKYDWTCVLDNSTGHVRFFCLLDAVKSGSGNSLLIYWLGLRVFTARGAGSVPGWGAKDLASYMARLKTDKQNPLKKDWFRVTHFT